MSWGLPKGRFYCGEKLLRACELAPILIVVEDLTTPNCAQKTPPPLISYRERKSTNSREQMLKDRDMIISALKENLAIAQNRMKNQVDLH